MLDISQSPPKSSAIKVTATEIEKRCPAKLQDIGKRIDVHLTKAAQHDDKAEQHRISAGQLLAEAQAACDGGGFTAFRERFCPNLGKSRAHELLLIASGRKTVEETKAATRERVKKHRATKAATPKPSVTVTDEASADERKAEDVTEAEAEPEIVEDAEAEIKRLKALKTKLKNNNDDKIDAAASAKALAVLKLACDQLPEMNADDLQAGIDYFAEAVEVPATELMPDLKYVQMDLKIAKAEVAALKRKLAGKLPPRESRAARWQRLAGEAEHDVEELISMQQEFQEAGDSQPDGLQDGPFAQKCNEICDIDLEGALGTLQEASGVEGPLGFGRD
jgi:hypothetical protein